MKKILCLTTSAIPPNMTTSVRVSYTEFDITGVSAETETEMRKFWTERCADGTTQTFTTKEVEHWEEGVIEDDDSDTESDDEDDEVPEFSHELADINDHGFTACDVDGVVWCYNRHEDVWRKTDGECYSDCHACEDNDKEKHKCCRCRKEFCEDDLVVEDDDEDYETAMCEPCWEANEKRSSDEFVAHLNRTIPPVV